MLYIPLQSCNHTLALGIFDTEDEAKDAYVEYITSHLNYDSWLVKTKNEYKEEIGEEMPDLKEAIFMEYDDEGTGNDLWETYNDLYQEIECFWPERGINFPPDIEMSRDFHFVSKYSGWICEFDGVNHLAYLISHIARHHDDEFRPDIKKLAEQYPVL